MTDQQDKLEPLESAKESATSVGAWVKKHPTVLIMAAGALGVSGEVVTQILAADIPGWAAGGLVLLYAAVDWARKVGVGIFELVDQFKQFRQETTERFKAGDGLFQKLLRNQEIDRAEIQAHAEQLERIRKHVKLPTDKVPPGNGS